MNSNNYKPTNQTASKINNHRSPHQTNSQRNSTEKLALNGHGYPLHVPVEISPHQDQEQSLKAQNIKLKKMLKEAQAKRIQITKQCSDLANKFDRLEEQNMQLHRKLKDVRDLGQGEKFRYEQLKFLNKELSAQIQELQKQNATLNEKLKHYTQSLEKKYEEIEQRTFKKIEQALKRIKKAIHYLSTLSIKQIQKTKEIQIQNLTKAAEVLKGKYNPDSKFEEEIQELMNPIRNIQQELHRKMKEVGLLKEQNVRLSNEVKKHKKIEKQVLPQYKQAIEKLKKNLGQVRMQLSENQYDKVQIKRKYEQKLKETQLKFDELFTEHRKLKLENKIFQKKIEQMEDDVQEEKHRLMGENELLKKLYKSQDQKSRRSVEKDLGLEGYLSYKNEEQGIQEQEYAETLSYKTKAYQFRKPIDQYLKKGVEEAGVKKNQGQGQKTGQSLKKNYSASQLNGSIKYQEKEIIRKKQRAPLQLKQNPIPKYGAEAMSESRGSNKSRRNYEHLRLGQEKKNVEHTINKESISEYNQNEEFEENQNWTNERSQRQDANFDEGSGMSASQDGLKNQIFKIDQEIMEIQKTLDRELNMYK